MGKKNKGQHGGAAAVWSRWLSSLPSLASAQWWAGCLNSAEDGNDLWNSFSAYEMLFMQSFLTTKSSCALQHFLFFCIYEFLILTGEYWLLEPWQRLYGVNRRYDVELHCKLMHTVNLKSLLPDVYSLYLNYFKFWLSILPAWQMTCYSCIFFSLKDICRSIFKQIYKLYDKRVVFF